MKKIEKSSNSIINHETFSCYLFIFSFQLYLKYLHPKKYVKTCKKVHYQNLLYKIGGIRMMVKLNVLHVFELYNHFRKTCSFHDTSGVF